MAESKSKGGLNRFSIMSISNLIKSTTKGVRIFEGALNVPCINFNRCGTNSCKSMLFKNINIPSDIEHYVKAALRIIKYLFCKGDVEKQLY
jgi:hypothetical protein